MALMILGNTADCLQNSTLTALGGLGTCNYQFLCLFTDNLHLIVTFEDLTAVLLRTGACRNVVLCHWMAGSQHFKGL